jgi:hypothetical protein
VLEKRSAQEVFQFHADNIESFGIDRIRLGDHRNAASNREQTADVEVFDRLRLDAFIGGDDEQDEIDATDTGEHVAHETLVPGDIDEAKAQIFIVRSLQVQVREADVDGDPATLLFFETIGVDAGERFDEGGFAVIDVAGGADNDGLHVQNDK